VRRWGWRRTRSVIATLIEFDKLWASLFPAEQTRVARLLVARVTVGGAGIAVDLRHDGVAMLTRKMMARQTQRRAA
jgi:hypothetical protein